MSENKLAKRLVPLVMSFGSWLWPAQLEAQGIAEVALRQSYQIPVTVRVVRTEDRESGPKLTESETFRGLWRIFRAPLGRVTVSHRGAQVSATVLESANGSTNLIVPVAGFLELLGLSRPYALPEQAAANPQQLPLVEVPLWSYPAGVRYAASSQGTGYLSFYIITGGELPGS